MNTNLGYGGADGVNSGGGDGDLGLSDDDEGGGGGDGDEVMTHGEGGGGTGAGGEWRGVERDDRSVGLVILSQPCSEAIKQAAHAAGEC